MKKSIRRRFMDRPLRFKMIAVFSILFLLMMGVVSVISNTLVRRNSEEQARYAASQAFAQVEAALTRKAENAVFASDVLASLEPLSVMLEKSARGGVDLGDEYRAMLDTMKTMTVLQTQDIMTVRIYAPGGFTYANQNLHFVDFDELPAETVAAARRNGRGVIWLPPWTIRMSLTTTARAVSMLRLLRSGDDYADIIGAQCVSLSADMLDALLQHGGAVESEYLYLMNSEGKLISASLPDFPSDAPLLPEGAFPQWDKVTVDGADYIACAALIANTDWRLVAMLPAVALGQAGADIVYALLGWMLLIAAVTIGTICVVCHSLTSRIRRLAREMERVRGGRTDVYVDAKYDDEIGHLCASFNYMTSELNALARQQYENGKAIKQSELKALQAQINPHFLYNTLDLINWEALDLGAQKIARLTQAMARFYRLSLGRGKDFVHIQNELDHVAAYVEVQNFRFDNKLELITEVEGELGYAPILKLVLQPLVENCILHGILDKRGADGRILITVGGRGADILIRIRDYGSGMTREQVERILLPPEEDGNSQGGYGVYNIHRRIRLCYGDPYGLRFESVPNEGTTVELLIPDTRTEARRKGDAAPLSDVRNIAGYSSIP